MTASNRITEIEQELRGIETRRHELLSELQKIKQELETPKLPLSSTVPRTGDEKIVLFLSLFGAGRSVYPRLWENPKTGRNL